MIIKPYPNSEDEIGSGNQNLTTRTLLKKPTSRTLTTQLEDP